MIKDIERVVNGLKFCRKHGSLGGNDCWGHWAWTDDHKKIVLEDEYKSKCAYADSEPGCVVALIGDAINLLEEYDEYKKQEGKA